MPWCSRPGVRATATPARPTPSRSPRRRPDRRRRPTTSAAARPTRAPTTDGSTTTSSTASTSSHVDVDRAGVDGDAGDDHGHRHGCRRQRRRGRAGRAAVPRTEPFAEAVRLSDGTCVGWAGSQGGSTVGLTVGAPVTVLDAVDNVEIGPAPSRPAAGRTCQPAASSGTACSTSPPR